MLRSKIGPLPLYFVECYTHYFILLQMNGLVPSLLILRLMAIQLQERPFLRRRKTLIRHKGTQLPLELEILHILP